MVDVVTPLGPLDNTRTLSSALTDIEVQQVCTRNNVIGIRDHHIVTRQNIAGAFDEAGFPFSFDDLRPRFKDDKRVGWYLQQLIKLYAWKVIPGLSDPYVVIDADTYFLKATNFEEDGRLLFTRAPEYHKPYFEHMQRLLPGLHRVQDCSGVAHHMPLSHEILEDLFNRVESTHGVAFWEAFLNCVDSAHREGSGASEYETVFNFTQMHHPHRFQLRELDWKNKSRSSGLDVDCQYVSLHWYL
tara:strand:- start:1535 stop:2263 length:729 start_codon:yes stop_codon:yes gene_type:complete